MSIVQRTDKCIDLTGIEDHTARELNIVHTACVVKTHLGDAILHIYQGAYMPDGKSIVSPLQLEAHGCTVVDKARGLNGGEQPYIQSPDGYHFPLSMAQGLLCAKVRPVLDSEWSTLNHAHLTSDKEWDPRLCDHGIDKDWDADIEDPVEEHYMDLPYDRFGHAKSEELSDGDDEDGEPHNKSGDRG